MQQTKSITRAHLQRLLLLGLGLSAALLLSALLVGIRTVHQIDKNTQTFASGEAQTKAAIDEIEKQQAVLNANWVQLAKKDMLRREEVLDQLAQARQQMSAALESAYEQAEFLRENIYQEGHGLLRFTVWLFATCVGLSLLCASWAVRTSTGLFRRLEQQAGELTRLQYQFLETQEDIARRFSHELHDELGQALTAVKANLGSLRDHPADEARVEDCLHLVDRAIKDVREMSQLLRPTILDDFGLDAALRSLVESFGQRTGIQVNYECTLKNRRLRDEAESHLYRIAQEALTNVARHSHATNVSVSLLSKGAEVVLSIEDNGNGFDSNQPRQSPGLGLAGIETRARGCGGVAVVTTDPGKGVTITVTCPDERTP